MEYTIEHLNELYDLELDKVVTQIDNLKVTSKSKAKMVLLQFPDGLKQYATSVVDYLEEKTDASFMIWLDTCYGACDSPVLDKQLGSKIDLTIQFGHNEMMPGY